MPVLRDSVLVNPGAELNSDGLDKRSDTASIPNNSDQDSTNESGTESSGKDEEEDSGQYVKNKCEPTNTTAVNDNDSDIEDAPSKKHPKTKSTKKSAKYTPISGQKGSIVRDQFELKQIAMDIK